MRKVLLTIPFALMLLTALPAYSQNPNYDVKQVWRVIYFHLKPGQGEAFWKDMRENLKPVYESFKKEGIISDYKVWNNATTETANDWDVAVGLMYANWAALDEADAKGATIAAKHYGSRDTMIEAGKKRNDLREVVMSKLVREVMPK